jgi:hypothetical protein
VMERQLRDLMIAEAGEPPRRVTVEAVRRRAIRRWAAQAGAACLAVVLAVGLGAAVGAGLMHTGKSAARRAGEHAGPPLYYVIDYFDREAHKFVMAVRARASGRVTAVIRDPLSGPGSACDQGRAGLAAADDQTFFMVCTIFRQAPGSARRPGKISFMESRIYRFQVTGSGRVTGYTPVKGGTISGWVGNIAASLDGSEIAAEVTQLSPSGQLATNRATKGIFVINTRTGSRALWYTGPRVPGAVQYASAQDLSFTGDGRELVVLEAWCRGGRYVVYCNGQADMQVRAYSPASQGGPLKGGQVLLRGSKLEPRGTFLSSAVIIPDGSAVTGLLTDCHRHVGCTMTVARIPVGTSQPSRVLYQGSGGGARFFSTDPSGRYVMLNVNAGKARLNGWIDHGRLVPLAPGNGAFDGTW